MRLLSRREHSAYELAQKLAQREFEPAEIAQTLAELKQGGWLSDERFTEAYIRMRQQKGYGPVRIRMELKERGVDEGIIAQYLDDDAVDWLAGLQQQYRKKYRDRAIGDYTEKARRIRFLQYRGFTMDAIQRVVK